MSEMHITGGRKLIGETEIQGAKNSALPILAACFAAGSPCEIHSCPALTDVNASLNILRCLGCRAVSEGQKVFIDSSAANRCDIPERLMREMRSSISFLGAVLSRCGEAELSTPGGCELGARPVDLHLTALARMGAKIEESHGRIHCSVPKGKLEGAAIPLSFPSVGATENIMVAAATAEGTTVITNAAREPEIVDLAAFMCSCGARISGAGESTITIEGVPKLHGCIHTVIPDRIEAVTFMAAAAMTGGDVLLRNADYMHLLSAAAVLEEMGCIIREEKDGLRLTANKRLCPAGYVRTMPYPGFPTDAQAIIMAAACIARGTSVFVENIFDNRFKHVGELCRLGASIKTEGRAAVVEGVPRLTGASVASTDLRGGAALIIAGTAAEGKTIVSGLHHVDRGYQSIEKKLRSLGADIERKEDSSKKENNSVNSSVSG